MSVARNSARVGAAAFALGLSLAGTPACGIAAADSADSGSTAPSTQSDQRADRTSKAAARASRAAKDPGPAIVRSAAARPAAAAATMVPDTTAPDSDSDLAAPVKSARSRTAKPGVTASAAATRAPRAAAATAVSAVEEVSAVKVRAARISATPSPTTLAGAVTAAAADVAALSVPAGLAAASSPFDFITNLLAPIQGLLDGIGLLIRRTFLNEAPTVSPVQTSGQVTGPITGNIGAVDPEGDPISYSVTQAPQHGTVSVGADGTYTYTPGSGFTGLDGFTVAATDEGFHINLLDLFRPAATEAYSQVSQNPDGAMLTFSFIYGSGSQFWSQTARNALQSSALTLASYLVVGSPVTVTFDVTAFSDGLSGTLASSGSDLTDAGAGFFDTVVQQKIITGVDANGGAADGTIDWNFGRSWGYGSVSGGQYDFTSTAMHELLHTFGFLSNTDQSGSGTSWTTFDSLITTSGGTPVIDGTTFLWKSPYKTNLTGGNGGLYFGGTNAVAVYGSPVPLYTPNPWESGSSVSHLRDSAFTGANEKLMNSQVSTGVGVRIVSSLELAILKDIGYTVSETPIVAFLFVSLGLVRRRRNAA